MSGEARRALFVGGPLAGTVQTVETPTVAALVTEPRGATVTYVPETFVLAETGLRIMVVEGLTGLDLGDETLRAIAAALDLEAVALPRAERPR